MNHAHRVKCVQAAQELPGEEADVLPGEALGRLNQRAEVCVVQLGHEIQLAPVDHLAPGRRNHRPQAEQVRVRVVSDVAENGELTQAAPELQRVGGRADAFDRDLPARARRSQRVCRHDQHAIRALADWLQVGVALRQYKRRAALASADGVDTARHVRQRDGRPLGHPGRGHQARRRGRRRLPRRAQQAVHVLQPLVHLAEGQQGDQTVGAALRLGEGVLHVLGVELVHFRPNRQQ
mmetsp:Transcript_26673/g.86173  ORF Transcript_26673/g.86173 Transcript_26673/m.86173 type:complete len:236 (+) Transcript_26673:431-1138(+)